MSGVGRRDELLRFDGIVLLTSREIRKTPSESQGVHTAIRAARKNGIGGNSRLNCLEPKEETGHELPMFTHDS